ncbi:MAG: hypothetical protein CM1200mP4_0520 [Rhodospirillaceae bacterium]|nr:MAG: hypothetical protein CM1200mP4_0520 [Rhodospirillaceae bacterium]
MSENVILRIVSNFPLYRLSSYLGCMFKRTGTTAPEEAFRQALSLLPGLYYMDGFWAR